MFLRYLRDAPRRGSQIETLTGMAEPKHDVFSHAQRRNQHELLMDHAHLGCDGIARGSDPHLAIRHQDFAAIRLHHSLENLH